MLGSEDPVRAYQQFSTVDLLSKGRAEMMVGRGSFTESFPLFGYDLDDYDELFAEKLDLLLALRENEKISWSGKHRPSIDNRAVYPQPMQPDRCPFGWRWEALPNRPTGRAHWACRWRWSIIGGQPERFKSLADLHRRGAEEAGHSAPALEYQLPRFHCGELNRKPLISPFPYLSRWWTVIGGERGWSPTDPRPV
ncbi:MAG: LLM class flavin-dependent oxidoreductase [Balneolaceae bacterium]|nr:LLM class flavin-dependent oxidoreductase [Balneolaceae bacterium]